MGGRGRWPAGGRRRRRASCLRKRVVTRWIEISRKKSCERNPTLPVGGAGRERVPSCLLVSGPSIPPGSYGLIEGGELPN